MRIPTTAMAGNLRWTRSGVVWADFVLNGIPYGMRPTKDKYRVRAMHTGLFRALPGESLLLGVCAGLEPAAIVERMLDGVTGECPEWLSEAEATLDTLDEIGPGERIYWLSVPLSHRRPQDWLLEPLQASVTDLKDRAGLPRAGISDKEVARRLKQAEAIAARLPAPFRARPATPAQMLWLDLHAQQRGLYQDMNLPDRPGLGEDLPPVRSALGVGEPVLDEGAKSDRQSAVPENPGLKQILLGAVTRAGDFNPLQRRVLKVIRADEPGNPPASYQAMLVLSDMPTAGALFPGSEFLGRVDESGLDVDWAVRLSIRSSEQARSANNRALNNLNDQYHQREGEMSHDVDTVLGRSARDVAEYAAALESDKDEVEVQATAIFAVAGASVESALEQAHALADWYSPTEHKLVQPPGYQTELWWLMHPGAPTTRAVREFAQITTSKNIAGAIPLASNHVGDRRGSVLALNITNGPLMEGGVPCGPTSVIMHDPEGAAREGQDISGSFAVTGELGSGKSTLLKKVGGDILARRGQVLAVDRTAMGEYVEWARSVADCVVVDPEDPAVSVDPLRVFGPTQGTTIAQTFLTRLLDVSPTAPAGVTLSAVMKPTYLAEHGIHGLGDLKEHLATCPDLGEVAVELARTMDVFASKDFGRVIFDSSVPALSLSSQAVVIRTHTLELPSEMDLTHEHLFRQMGAEKIFGRAMYALIASLVQAVGFADRARLFAFITDEFHGFNSSPESVRPVANMIRDGRKHNAVVALGSHDALDDFGSETMRELVPLRILMRHRSAKLAARGLEWLGFKPKEIDDELIELVTKETSPKDPATDEVPMHRRGECLIRDAAGNVGRGKVLQPSSRQRSLAGRTSAPPREQQLARSGS